LIIEAYETKIGPHNGAKVVAKAWTDPEFKRRLLEDGSKTIATLGHFSRVGDHLVAVENTPKVHNMVVCTLCSCYPWDMLGLPPGGERAGPFAPAPGKDPGGGARGLGVHAAKGAGDPGGGPARRDAFPGAADASRRHRGLERGPPRRDRHPRFDDRHRPA